MSGSGSSWTDSYLESLGIDPNGGQTAATLQAIQQAQAHYTGTYGKYNSGGGGGGGFTAGLFAPIAGYDDTTGEMLAMQTSSDSSNAAQNPNDPRFENPSPPPAPKYSVATDLNAVPSNSTIVAWGTNYGLDSNGNVVVGGSNTGLVGEQGGTLGTFGGNNDLSLIHI